MVKRTKGMQCYSCDNCGEDYFRFSSQVRGVTKTCSRVCSVALSNKIGKFSGKNNPNYRHGLHTGPVYCVCGKEMDFRAKQCAVCSNKGVPKQPEYRKTDQEVIDLVPKHTSYVDIANEIKTSRSRVAKIVKENNLDISHFVACKHRPTQQDAIFRLREEGTRSALPRQAILEYELLDYRCSICGLEDEWNGYVLTLELDHINGNKLDDRLENLRFLCPNCHSCTPTYKGRNIRRIYE